MSDSLASRLTTRNATVGVIGLGYVGLPLAVSFAEVGFLVRGFDVSEQVVTGLNSGASHIDDIASARVTQLIGTKKFRATTASADLA